MENLTIADLRNQLDSLNLDSTGTKVEMIQRLKDHYCEIQNKESDAQVEPEDSASQVSYSSRKSKASSIGSIRLNKAMESARKAGLIAKAQKLKQKQKLEEEILRAQQASELLSVEAEIEESQAKESVLSQIEEEFRNESQVSRNQERLISSEPPKLNVKAETFVPRQNVSFNLSNVAPTNENRNNTIDSSQNASIMQTLISYNLKSLIPKANIEPFCGDYTTYRTFIRAFDSVISSKLVDYEEKLLYLEQFTRNKPREIVRSCLEMSADEGYSQARDLLEKRYGSPFHINDAYVQKILSHPNIKGDDVEALDKFSVLLISCKNAMTNIPLGQRETEHPKTIQKIVEKLAPPIQERWRRIVYNIYENQYRQVSFRDLVEFIETEVKVASHPVYGRAAMSTYKGQEKTNVKSQHGKGSSKINCNTVNEKSSEKKVSKCLYCKEDHYFTKCIKFDKLNIKDKLSFIAENGICYSCLRSGHRSRECNRKLKCQTCDRRHPTTLHDNYQRSDNNSKEINKSFRSNENDIPGNSESSTSNSNFKVLTKKVCTNSTTVDKMSILPVKIQTTDGSFVTTHAFIDSGSTASFCTEELLEEIKCKNIANTSICISTITDKNVKQSSKLVNELVICDQDENNFIRLPPVFTIKEIPVTQEEIVTNNDLDKWPHLSELKLHESNAKIGLLIGNNVPEATEPWQIIHSPADGEPYAMKTKLGWIVCGSSISNSRNLKMNRVLLSNEDITTEIKAIFNKDFENLHYLEKGLSCDDKKWLNIIEKSCKINEIGHYEMPLPFKETDVYLANNKILIIKRLNYLKNKFMKDPKYHSEYVEKMNEMFSKKYAENVPIDELGIKHVWYIPHFGVINSRKQRKLRIVYDCSSKYKNCSLNDKLLQGPDLMTPLITVLLRFRFGLFAYVADIKHMFLQVHVSPDHRNYLRFLWWPNGDFNKPFQEYRMKVHLFGATSSPSCVNFVLRKIPLDNTGFTESARRVMGENFYVDDLLRSLDNENCLLKEALEIKEMCKLGNFELDKYKSNSQILLDAVSNNHTQVNTTIKFDKKDANVTMQKTLGIYWESTTDVFSVETSLHPKPFTRRGVLSTIGSVYDPLGIVAPFILQGKLILQDLCRLKADWDESLTQEHTSKWEKWLQSLNSIKKICIPRCIKPVNHENVLYYELHHFSDASSLAYATVSYIRGVTNSGDIFVSFLHGKTHVAPLKTVTIPRLELTAASLMINCDKMIRNSLNMISVQHSLYWTDSQTVIKYVNNEDRRFQVFVANKLSQIIDHSSPSQWKHIPTNLNPADEGSRGLQTERWLQGPQFLFSEEQDWPQSEILDLSLSDNDKNVKSVSNIVSNHENPLNILINYHSDWHKLKKSIAWLLKIKSYLLKKENFVNYLQVKDLDESENLILNHVQSQNFSNEMKSLKENKSVLCSSKINQFNPIMVGDLIRVGGRLNHSDLSFEEKHPILLPNKSPVTDMIIKYVHIREGHQGREHILSQIRKKYWILKGSSTVRSVLNNCFKCKRIQKPPPNQLMAELPPERMALNEPPFTNTGVDYFGPFYVKVLRSQVKRYGVIFTCMTTRAVHIEIAHTLDTSSFINALVRFTSRRGPVKYLRSDCGTNFVGAESDLKDALKNLNDAEISNSLLQKGIQWTFNTPHASHHGGVWERLIRTIRKIMNGLLNQQTLTDESLVTLMCEVENIMNSRPLTSTSSDVNDLNPLTPNHLLRLNGNTQCLGKFTDIDQYSRKRWRQIQHLADVFWFRWKNEYLKSLQSRHCWTSKRENLHVGDIVLLVDEMSPRCQWPLGRIIRVKTSKDNLIRSITVKTKSSEFDRPINKVILLLKQNEL